MRQLIIAAVLVVVALDSAAMGDVFNMGPELTSLEWVTVGDAGNAADTRYATSGYGGVDYAYRIGKYEVTAGQYTEFLNAVAAVGDPNGVYTTNMASGYCGIDRAGSGTGGDPWVYSAKGGDNKWLNRPVNYVNCYDAFRFANWLHNGQPGLATHIPQDGNSTEDGVYDMSLGDSVVRKPGALFWIPSENEWYKAAYYDPGKAGGAGYWNYPTQSDTVPTAEAPPGTDLVNGSANYRDGDYVDTSYYTTEVGAYNRTTAGQYVSDGPYGTFDQGGNVFEWNETFTDAPRRGARGGSYGDGMPGTQTQHAGWRDFWDPTYENSGVGFRVASRAVIPEPYTLTSVATGNWNATTTWDDGSLAPTEYHATVVGNHVVTLAANGDAWFLLIRDGGEIVVGTHTVLAIGHRLEVADGTLDIQGTLNTGFLEVALGKLGIQGTLNAGAVAIAGGTVDVRGNLNADSLQFDAGTLEIWGAVNAGSLCVAAGTMSVQGTLNAGPMEVAGGTVDIRGTVNADSLHFAAGTLEIRGTLEAGSVKVDDGTLEIRGTLEAGSVEVDDGRLAIAPTGALNVDGEVTMKVGSEYACELGASSSGLLTATGNVNLDGTLTLQPIDAGVPGPRFDQTIISSEGEVLGHFAVEPTEHNPLMGRVGHLALGVFHMSLNYVRSGPDPEDPVKSVTVDLFTAQGGDGNGDGYVDVRDINILLANFGTKPGENTWLENDCAGGDTGRGDGYVDVQDINILLANFGTHPDPGPASEVLAVAEYNPTAGEFTVIPEPSTLVLLLMGAVGLLVYAWRRGKQVIPVD